jgi:hypothetical protein
MLLLNARATLPTLLAALAIAACSGNGAVPAGGFNAGRASYAAPAIGFRPADNTSMLKKLTKDIVIGSTVDPKNGDTGPRAISIAKGTFGLKKGQLLVCNYADSSGTPGNGTTIELLNPKPNTKPVQWAQNSNIQGCVGDAMTTAGNQVYAAGQVSGLLAWFDQKGNFKKTYGSPLVKPLTNADAYPTNFYEPEYIYTSDAKTGSIVSLSAGINGNGNILQVITGFAVNDANGWGILGPSVVGYDKKVDTLYLADGIDNTIVAVSPASNLLQKNEIVVKPGGKTFKCLHAKRVCAKLVYSGKPLNAPLAATVLPNGNLIVANTKGGNTLVELTPAGKVLATKVVDKSQTAAVFGLAASGTSDKDTVLLFTDTNKNDLEELKP